MLFTHSASFASPVPPAGLPTSSTTTTQTSSGTSPPNESASRRRLRRLSHLRSYNPSHLLNRESSSNSGSGSEGITRSASDFNNGLAVPRSPQQVAGTQNRSANRLTLVTSAPVPPRATTSSNNSNNTNDHAASNTNGTSGKKTPPPRTLEQGQNSSGVSNSIEENPSSPAESISCAAQFEDSCVSPQLQPQPAMTRTRSSTTGDVAGAAAAATAAATAADFLPSIRFSAYYDPRSQRPSLTFPAITRTLPTGTEAIRVGRYSERDSQNMNSTPNNQPSAAPVGFKSKVVSRRHCEFWYENGKWYIKDVKSSSGTFLNHIRLSPPSQESKPFAVGDGDIVQLGIDFKGGEEMIFRCVKMRIELNRGWQNKLNTFNMAAHKRLRTMNKTPAEKAGSSSQDCSICLNMISPCQSLFVAPCSHTWHFKCVRSLLTSPQYPIFICPNCRAGCDLEADVEDPAEDWEQLDAEDDAADRTSVNGAPLANPTIAALADTSLKDSDAMDTTVALGATDGPGTLPHAISEPLPISLPLRSRASGSGHASEDHRGTPSPPHAHEGPITPRNEVGPWVFDGGAGQRPAEPVEGDGMRSLDAATENINGNANGANGGHSQLPSDSSEGSMR